MFSWSELLLIAVVALVVIGPKELPHVLHSLGKTVAKLRRSADEFRRQFEESMRDSGYEDLHKNIQDFRSLNPANQLRESINRAVNQEYSGNRVPSGGELDAGSAAAVVPGVGASPLHSAVEGEAAPAVARDAGPSPHSATAHDEPLNGSAQPPIANDVDTAPKTHIPHQAA